MLIQLATTLLVSGIIGSSAVQAAPQFQRHDGSWQSFVDGEGKKKTCFIVSQPTEQKGDFTKRGNPHVLVTHRPANKTYNTVSIVAGYTYKPQTEVEVKIGDQTFVLFVEGDTAWMKNDKQDSQIVEAMRNGVTMTVEGTSSRGNAIVDTYSLKGFQRAMNMIDLKCPRTKNMK